MVNKGNANKWEKFTEEVQSTNNKNDVPAKNESAKESLTKEQFNQCIIQELFDPKCIK